MEGGGQIGDYCLVDDDDGLPDLVCENQGYCVDHHCGAVCTGDADCGNSSMGCGMYEFPEGLDLFDEQPVPFSVPVCQWLGEPGVPCEVQSDCLEGVCTPWTPVQGTLPAQVELYCMEAPAGGLGIGARCGKAAWGQECDTRHCLLEEPEDNIAGYCSTVCRTRADCPDETPVGADVVNWLCEGKRLYHMGTTFLADDPYVSWCVPVSANSSLAHCGSTMKCDEPEEVCHTSIRIGSPGGVPEVDYLCVWSPSGKEIGEICDPADSGKDCRSGSCAHTTLPGVGFCTGPCVTNADCAGLGGGSAVCMARIAIPVEPPAQQVVTSECGIDEVCAECNDHRDCGVGLGCANLSSTTYIEDLRCVPLCEDDVDCSAVGTDTLCTDLPSPYETSKDGLVRACAPIVCPG